MGRFIQALKQKGLIVNIKKSKSWFNSVGNGISKCKTYKYLGIKLRSDGSNVKKDGSWPKLQDYTKSLKWVARKNYAKAFKLFDSYIGGYIRYQTLGGNDDDP